MMRPVAWAGEFDLHCERHREAADSPVYPDAEVDAPAHCAECGELLPLALTADGYRYVAEALVARHTDERGDERVLTEWRDEYASPELDAAIREAIAQWAGRSVSRVLRTALELADWLSDG